MNMNKGKRIYLLFALLCLAISIPDRIIAVENHDKDAPLVYLGMEKDNAEVSLTG